MAFHPSPNFRLNFRTSNPEKLSTAVTEKYSENISPQSYGSITPHQREDWRKAIAENWQEYARQTKLLVNAIETLFPNREKDNSFKAFLGKIPQLYSDIHEALNLFDRSDENLLHPEKIARLLRVANESLHKLVFQAEIAKQISSHTLKLHPLVEELFRVKQISHAFLKQLVNDIRLEFTALKCEDPPVLHPAVDYTDFLPIVEWQSEPQVYGQGIHTALLLLHVVQEFEFADYEIDRMVAAAIMQDIGLFALEKIHRQPVLKTEQSSSELYEQHPRFSAAMLDGVSGCPVQVLKMVGEHHERENGTGYPSGDSSRSFSNSSRLLALASRFVSRSTEDKNENARTDCNLASTSFLHATCEKIRTATLREQFNFEFTQKFIEALKLKPEDCFATTGSHHSGEFFGDQHHRLDQAEKLLPQPQLLTALGLSKVKPRFSSPS